MRPKSSGYSLVELMLVIILTAILATISITIGRNVLQRTSSTDVVNKFIADVNFIKQSASKENRYYAISFNADGVSYTIKKQTTIGVLINWTDVSTVKPLDGKEFYDKTVLTGGFAVNPIGLVYTLPIGTSPPASQSLNFRLPGRIPGTYDYNKNILIYSNGGIKIEQ
jgi:prepilin-type N-terminal cleavage/methylation domain-containing protein